MIKFRLNANTTAEESGIVDLSVADQDDALDVIDDIDSALQRPWCQSPFGAAQSRFNLPSTI